MEVQAELDAATRMNETKELYVWLTTIGQSRSGYLYTDLGTFPYTGRGEVLKC